MQIYQGQLASDEKKRRKKIIVNVLAKFVTSPAFRRVAMVNLVISVP